MNPMVLTLPTIQDEQTKEICQLVYTVKHTNGIDLGHAIMVAIGMPATLHFKKISMG